MAKIILASGSPRRKELLHLICEDFSVILPQVEEVIPVGRTPVQVVEYLAEQKGNAVALNHPHEIVIGADTLVALQGQLLGKPNNEEEAFEMLSALSGQQHQVVTGIFLSLEGEKQVFSVSTDVLFAELSPQEIWDYIHTGEPMDKAGAYGIQEKGARFIKKIQGDYFAVMGLPVQPLYEKLKDFLE